MVTVAWLANITLCCVVDGSLQYDVQGSSYDIPFSVKFRDAEVKKSRKNVSQ